MSSLLDRWRRVKSTSTVSTVRSKGNIFIHLFSPLIGSLGKRPRSCSKYLSRLMAKVLEDPISHILGWINGWIFISVARLYLRMLCGACLPSPLWEREPEWELGSGMVLVQWILRQIIFAPKYFCGTIPRNLTSSRTTKHPPHLPPPPPPSCILFKWRAGRAHMKRIPHAHVDDRQNMDWYKIWLAQESVIPAQRKKEPQYWCIKIEICLIMNELVRNQVAKSDRYSL